MSKFNSLKNSYIEFCFNEYQMNCDSAKKEFEKGRLKILYTELCLGDKDCELWLSIDLKEMLVKNVYVGKKNNIKLKEVSRKVSELELIDSFKNANFDNLFITNDY